MLDDLPKCVSEVESHDVREAVGKDEETKKPI